MFEQLVSSILGNVLGKYVKRECVSSENLNISVFGGYVILERLELRPDALDTHSALLPFPVALKKGMIQRLTLTFPWVNAGKTLVSVDGVCLLFETLYEWPQHREEPRNAQSIANKLQMVAAAQEYAKKLATRRTAADREEIKPKETTDDTTELSDPSAPADKDKSLSKYSNLHSEALISALEEQAPPNLEEPINPGFLQRFLSSLLENLQVNIRGVHIRFEDTLSLPSQPFALGLVIESVHLITLQQEDDPASSDNYPLKEDHQSSASVRSGGLPSRPEDASSSTTSRTRYPQSVFSAARDLVFKRFTGRLLSLGGAKTGSYYSASSYASGDSDRKAKREKPQPIRKKIAISNLSVYMERAQPPSQSTPSSQKRRKRSRQGVAKNDIDTTSSASPTMPHGQESHLSQQSQQQQQQQQQGGIGAASPSLLASESAHAETATYQGEVPSAPSQPALGATNKLNVPDTNTAAVASGPGPQDADPAPNATGGTFRDRILNRLKFTGWWGTEDPSGLVPDVDGEGELAEGREGASPNVEVLAELIGDGQNTGGIGDAARDARKDASNLDGRVSRSASRSLNESAQGREGGNPGDLTISASSRSISRTHGNSSDEDTDSLATNTSSVTSGSTYLTATTSHASPNRQQHQSVPATTPPPTPNIETDTKAKPKPSSTSTTTPRFHPVPTDSLELFYTHMHRYVIRLPDTDPAAHDRVSRALRGASSFEDSTPTPIASGSVQPSIRQDPVAWASTGVYALPNSQLPQHSAYLSAPNALQLLAPVENTGGDGNRAMMGVEAPATSGHPLSTDSLGDVHATSRHTNVSAIPNDTVGSKSSSSIASHPVFTSPPSHQALVQSHPLRDSLILLPLSVSVTLRLARSEHDLSQPQTSVDVVVSSLRLQLDLAHLPPLLALSDGIARHRVRSALSYLRPAQKIHPQRSHSASPQHQHNTLRVSQGPNLATRSWWLYAGTLVAHSLLARRLVTGSWDRMQEWRLLRKSYTWLYKRKVRGTLPPRQWSHQQTLALQTLLEERAKIVQGVGTGMRRRSIVGVDPRELMHSDVLKSIKSSPEKRVESRKHGDRIPGSGRSSSGTRASRVSSIAPSPSRAPSSSCAPSRAVSPTSTPVSGRTRRRRRDARVLPSLLPPPSPLPLLSLEDRGHSGGKSCYLPYPVFWYTVNPLLLETIVGEEESVTRQPWRSWAAEYKRLIKGIPTYLLLSSGRKKATPKASLYPEDGTIPKNLSGRLQAIRQHCLQPPKVTPPSKGYHRLNEHEHLLLQFLDQRLSNWQILLCRMTAFMELAQEDQVLESHRLQKEQMEKADTPRVPLTPSGSSERKKESQSSRQRRARVDVGANVSYSGLQETGDNPYARALGATRLLSYEREPDSYDSELNYPYMDLSFHTAADTIHSPLTSGFDTPTRRSRLEITADASLMYSPSPSPSPRPSPIPRQSPQSQPGRTPSRLSNPLLSRQSEMSSEFAATSAPPSTDGEQLDVEEAAFRESNEVNVPLDVMALRLSQDTMLASHEISLDSGDRYDPEYFPGFRNTSSASEGLLLPSDPHDPADIAPDLAGERPQDRTVEGTLDSTLDRTLDAWERHTMGSSFLDEHGDGPSDLFSQSEVDLPQPSAEQEYKRGWLHSLGIGWVFRTLQGSGSNGNDPVSGVSATGTAGAAGMSGSGASVHNEVTHVSDVDRRNLLEALQFDPNSVPLPFPDDYTYFALTGGLENLSLVVYTSQSKPTSEKRPRKRKNEKQERIKTGANDSKAQGILTPYHPLFHFEWQFLSCHCYLRPKTTRYSFSIDKFAASYLTSATASNVSPLLYTCFLSSAPPLSLTSASSPTTSPSPHAPFLTFLLETRPDTGSSSAAAGVSALSPPPSSSGHPSNRTPRHTPKPSRATDTPTATAEAVGLGIAASTPVTTPSGSPMTGQVPGAAAGTVTTPSATPGTGTAATAEVWMLRVTCFTVFLDPERLLSTWKTVAPLLQQDIPMHPVLCPLSPRNTPTLAVMPVTRHFILQNTRCYVPLLNARNSLFAELERSNDGKSVTAKATSSQSMPSTKKKLLDDSSQFRMPPPPPLLCLNLPILTVGTLFERSELSIPNSSSAPSIPKYQDTSVTYLEMERATLSLVPTLHTFPGDRAAPSSSKHAPETTKYSGHRKATMDPTVRPVIGTSAPNTPRSRDDPTGTSTPRGSVTDPRETSTTPGNTPTSTPVATPSGPLFGTATTNHVGATAFAPSKTTAPRAVEEMVPLSHSIIGPVNGSVSISQEEIQYPRERSFLLEAALKGVQVYLSPPLVQILLEEVAHWSKTYCTETVSQERKRSRHKDRSKKRSGRKTRKEKDETMEHVPTENSVDTSSTSDTQWRWNDPKIQSLINDTVHCAPLIKTKTRIDVSLESLTLQLEHSTKAKLLMRLYHGLKEEYKGYLTSNLPASLLRLSDRQDTRRPGAFSPSSHQFSSPFAASGANQPHHAGSSTFLPPLALKPMAVLQISLHDLRCQVATPQGYVNVPTCIENPECNPKMLSETKIQWKELCVLDLLSPYASEPTVLLHNFPASESGMAAAIVHTQFQDDVYFRGNDVDQMEPVCEMTDTKRANPDQLHRKRTPFDSDCSLGSQQPTHAPHLTRIRSFGTTDVDLGTVSLYSNEPTLVAALDLWKQTSEHLDANLPRIVGSIPSVTSTTATSVVSKDRDSTTKPLDSTSHLSPPVSTPSISDYFLPTLEIQRHDIRLSSLYLTLTANGSGVVTATAKHLETSVCQRTFKPLRAIRSTVHGNIIPSCEPFSSSPLENNAPTNTLNIHAQLQLLRLDHVKDIPLSRLQSLLLRIPRTQILTGSPMTAQLYALHDPFLAMLQQSYDHTRSTPLLLLAAKTDANPIALAFSMSTDPTSQQPPGNRSVPTTDGCIGAILQEVGLEAGKAGESDDLLGREVLYRPETSVDWWIDGVPKVPTAPDLRLETASLFLSLDFEVVARLQGYILSSSLLAALTKNEHEKTGNRTRANNRNENTWTGKDQDVLPSEKNALQKNTISDEMAPEARTSVEGASPRIQANSVPSVPVSLWLHFKDVEVQLPLYSASSSTRRSRYIRLHSDSLLLRQYVTSRMEGAHKSPSLYSNFSIFVHQLSAEDWHHPSVQTVSPSILPTSDASSTPSAFPIIRGAAVHVLLHSLLVDPSLSPTPGSSSTLVQLVPGTLRICPESVALVTSLWTHQIAPIVFRDNKRDSIGPSGESGDTHQYSPPHNSLRVSPRATAVPSSSSSTPMESADSKETKLATATVETDIPATEETTNEQQPSVSNLAVSVKQLGVQLYPSRTSSSYFAVTIPRLLHSNTEKTLAMDDESRPSLKTSQVVNNARSSVASASNALFAEELAPPVDYSDNCMYLGISSLRVEYVLNARTVEGSKSHSPSANYVLLDSLHIQQPIGASPRPKQSGFGDTITDEKFGMTYEPTAEPLFLCILHARDTVTRTSRDSAFPSLLHSFHAAMHSESFPYLPVHQHPFPSTPAYSYSTSMLDDSEPSYSSKGAYVFQVLAHPGTLSVHPVPLHALLQSVLTLQQAVNAKGPIHPVPYLEQENYYQLVVEMETGVLQSKMQRMQKHPRGSVPETPQRVHRSGSMAAKSKDAGVFMEPKVQGSTPFATETQPKSPQSYNSKRSPQHVPASSIIIPLQSTIFRIQLSRTTVQVHYAQWAATSTGARSASSASHSKHSKVVLRLQIPEVRFLGKQVPATPCAWRKHLYQVVYATLLEQRQYQAAEDVLNTYSSQLSPCFSKSLSKPSLVWSYVQCSLTNLQVILEERGYSSASGASTNTSSSPFALAKAAGHKTLSPSIPVPNTDSGMVPAVLSNIAGLRSNPLLISGLATSPETVYTPLVLPISVAATVLFPQHLPLYSSAQATAISLATNVGQGAHLSGGTASTAQPPLVASPSIATATSAPPSQVPPLDPDIVPPYVASTSTTTAAPTSPDIAALSRVWSDLAALTHTWNSALVASAHAALQEALLTRFQKLSHPKLEGNKPSLLQKIWGTKTEQTGKLVQDSLQLPLHNVDPIEYPIQTTPIAAVSATSLDLFVSIQDILTITKLAEVYQSVLNASMSTNPSVFGAHSTATSTLGSPEFASPQTHPGTPSFFDSTALYSLDHSPGSPSLFSRSPNSPRLVSAATVGGTGATNNGSPDSVFFRPKLLPAPNAFAVHVRMQSLACTLFRYDPATGLRQPQLCLLSTAPKLIYFAPPLHPLAELSLPLSLYGVQQQTYTWQSLLRLPGFITTFATVQPVPSNWLPANLTTYVRRYLESRLFQQSTLRKLSNDLSSIGGEVPMALQPKQKIQRKDTSAIRKASERIVLQVLALDSLEVNVHPETVRALVYFFEEMMDPVDGSSSRTTTSSNAPLSPKPAVPPFHFLVQNCTNTPLRYAVRPHTRVKTSGAQERARGLSITSALGLAASPQHHAKSPTLSGQSAVSQTAAESHLLLGNQTQSIRFPPGFARWPHAPSVDASSASQLDVEELRLLSALEKSVPHHEYKLSLFTRDQSLSLLSLSHTAASKLSRPTAHCASAFNELALVPPCSSCSAANRSRVAALSLPFPFPLAPTRQAHATVLPTVKFFGNGGVLVRLESPIRVKNHFKYRAQLRVWFPKQVQADGTHKAHVGPLERYEFQYPFVSGDRQSGTLGGANEHWDTTLSPLSNEPLLSSAASMEDELAIHMLEPSPRIGSWNVSAEEYILMDTLDIAAESMEYLKASLVAPLYDPAWKHLAPSIVVQPVIFLSDTDSEVYLNPIPLQDFAAPVDSLTELRHTSQDSNGTYLATYLLQWSQAHEYANQSSKIASDEVQPKSVQPFATTLHLLPTLTLQNTLPLPVRLRMVQKTPGTSHVVFRSARLPYLQETLLDVTAATELHVSNLYLSQPFLMHPTLPMKPVDGDVEDVQESEIEELGVLRLGPCVEIIQKGSIETTGAISNEEKSCNKDKLEGKHTGMSNFCEHDTVVTDEDPLGSESDLNRAEGSIPEDINIRTRSMHQLLPPSLQSSLYPSIAHSGPNRIGSRAVAGGALSSASSSLLNTYMNQSQSILRIRKVDAQTSTLSTTRMASKPTLPIAPSLTWISLRSATSDAPVGNSLVQIGPGTLRDPFATSLNIPGEVAWVPVVDSHKNTVHLGVLVDRSMYATYSIRLFVPGVCRVPPMVPLPVQFASVTGYAQSKQVEGMLRSLWEISSEASTSVSGLLPSARLEFDYASDYKRRKRRNLKDASSGTTPAATPITSPIATPRMNRVQRVSTEQMEQDLLQPECLEAETHNAIVPFDLASSFDSMVPTSPTSGSISSAGICLLPHPVLRQLNYTPPPLSQLPKLSLPTPDDDTVSEFAYVQPGLTPFSATPLQAIPYESFSLLQKEPVPHVPHPLQRKLLQKLANYTQPEYSLPLVSTYRDAPVTAPPHVTKDTASSLSPATGGWICSVGIQASERTSVYWPCSVYESVGKMTRLFPTTPPPPKAVRLSVPCTFFATGSAQTHLDVSVSEHIPVFPPSTTSKLESMHDIERKGPRQAEFQLPLAKELIVQPTFSFENTTSLPLIIRYAWSQSALQLRSAHCALQSASPLDTTPSTVLVHNSPSNSTSDLFFAVPDDLSAYCFTILLPPGKQVVPIFPNIQTTHPTWYSLCTLPNSDEASVTNTTSRPLLYSPAIELPIAPDATLPIGKATFPMSIPNPNAGSAFFSGEISLESRANRTSKTAKATKVISASRSTTFALHCFRVSIPSEAALRNDESFAQKAPMTSLEAKHGPNPTMDASLRSIEEETLKSLLTIQNCFSNTVFGISHPEPKYSHAAFVAEREPKEGTQVSEESGNITSVVASFMHPLVQQYQRTLQSPTQFIHLPTPISPHVLVRHLLTNPKQEYKLWILHLPNAQSPSSSASKSKAAPSAGSCTWYELGTFSTAHPVVLSYTWNDPNRNRSWSLAKEPLYQPFLVLSMIQSPQSDRSNLTSGPLSINAPTTVAESTSATPSQIRVVLQVARFPNVGVRVTVQPDTGPVGYTDDDLARFWESRPGREDEMQADTKNASLESQNRERRRSTSFVAKSDSSVAASGVEVPVLRTYFSTYSDIRVGLHQVKINLWNSAQNPASSIVSSTLAETVPSNTLSLSLQGLELRIFDRGTPPFSSDTSTTPSPAHRGRFDSSLTPYLNTQRMPAYRSGSFSLVALRLVFETQSKACPLVTWQPPEQKVLETYSGPDTLSVDWILIPDTPDFAKFAWNATSTAAAVSSQGGNSALRQWRHLGIDSSLRVTVHPLTKAPLSVLIDESILHPLVRHVAHAMTPFIPSGAAGSEQGPASHLKSHPPSLHAIVLPLPTAGIHLASFRVHPLHATLSWKQASSNNGGSGGDRDTVYSSNEMDPMEVQYVLWLCKQVGNNLRSQLRMRIPTLITENKYVCPNVGAIIAGGMSDLQVTSLVRPLATYILGYPMDTANLLLFVLRMLFNSQN